MLNHPGTEKKHTHLLLELLYKLRWPNLLNPQHLSGFRQLRFISEWWIPVFKRQSLSYLKSQSPSILWLLQSTQIPSSQLGKRKREEVIWANPECGLHHFCPHSVSMNSVGMNSVTRSHLAARKAGIYSLAMCPGERGNGLDECFVSLCHICQRKNMLTWTHM